MVIMAALALGRGMAPISETPSFSANMLDGAITDINSFMQQVRNAKAALLRGLLAEDGQISDDMHAVISGLSGVNPTAPNPAEDIDLWSG